MNNEISVGEGIAKAGDEIGGGIGIGLCAIGLAIFLNGCLASNNDQKILK